MTDYDRLADIKAFDDTKAGVKGLVDAGVTTIPRFFHHPRDTNNNNNNNNNNHFTPTVALPIIDLQGLDDSTRREQVVNEVQRASELFGFFQIVNHGIPVEVLDEMREGVRRFNEQDVELKKQYYSRDWNRKVTFNSNFDLYTAPAASWRDSVFCFMAPDPPTPEELPLACREVIMDYMKAITKVADTVFEILSESLGLKSNYLKNINLYKSQIFTGHYYPPCPQPELTFGTPVHIDSTVLTLLLQDDIGGLQVLYQNQWVDVPPIHGALVVNIGDFLQLISNDKFKSVKHQVLASKKGPRISVAVFFSPSDDETRSYGPIKEMLSDQNPPLYKELYKRDFNTLLSKRQGPADSVLNLLKL